MKRTLAILASGAALGASLALTLASIADPPPKQWTWDTLSQDDTSYILANVLPYYRTDPPASCRPHSPCWIGSNLDTRTDAEILASLPHDLERITRP